MGSGATLEANALTLLGWSDTLGGGGARRRPQPFKNETQTRDPRRSKLRAGAKLEVCHYGYNTCREAAARVLTKLSSLPLATKLSFRPPKAD